MRIIKDGLSFAFNPESKKLVATFTPISGNEIKFTVAYIQQRLSEENFSYLFFPANSLYQLARFCNHSADQFQLEIGELKDASCEVIVSTVAMSATLTISPAFGGKSLTLSDIHAALEEAGVVYGIMSDQEIEQRLQENCTNFEIAIGLHPIDGVDTKFQSLVPEMIERPEINDEDICDFRESSSLVIIQEHQPVMRRIPAVRGQEGYNVFGKLLDCYHGIEYFFSPNQQGVYNAPEDNNLLLSTLTGTATLIPNGIIVLPVLIVESVNIETGNINFAGTVIVRGDVETGMKIYALNDLTIEGCVENASLECGGVLTVSKSVQNSQLKADKDIFLRGGINTTKVVSHASVTVMFAEYSQIEAGLDIVICDFSLNSGLFAGNKIAVGRKGSRKKSITGGIAWAMLEIKASILGVNTEVPTYVRVGSDPHIQRRIDELNHLISENDKEQGYIKKLLVHVVSKQGLSNEQKELHKKLKLHLVKLLSERASYDNEYLKLHENMALMDFARVTADRQAHIGCEIQVSGIAYKVSETLGQSIFRNKEGKITMTNKLSNLIKNGASKSF